MARFNLGHMEGENRNVDQVVKHWTIAASGGCYDAMHQLSEGLKKDMSAEMQLTQLVPVLR